MQELNKHIRRGVLLAWIVVWNLVCGAGIWLNGGLGPMNSDGSLVLAAIALLGSAAFAFAVIAHPGVRTWALRPDGQIEAVRKELWFLVALTGGLGIAALVSIGTRPAGA